MKLNNMSASAFANQIGVQPSSVSHVLSGRNKPSLEFIQKILVAFPKVDPNWLINGSTKMEPSSLKVDAPAPSNIEEPKISQKIEQDAKANDSNIENKLSKDNLSGKSIDKIVVFYTDGTFSEYNSAK